VPEPTSSASQLKALEANDPTKAELQDCANARAEVLAANTNLQTVVTLLTTPKPSTPTTVKKSSASSSSSSSSSNARAVASAKADLLKAEQDLQAANDDLDAATLVAPISGTVGLVGLTKGDSASGGTISIVGSGNAVVTIELPLKTRSLVTVGQEVTVTPAGSTTAMKGKVTAISTLETSGTSGTTTTYATTVAVSDADQLLASGAKASVAIAVKSASGVIRVPASAVTPTGTGTATVMVVASATADTTTSVTVKTGTVGGGWVEITEGLEAGKLVVLADRTAAIPTNSNRRRTTTTSTSSSSASAAASATAQPTSGASTQASAQPTASATK
jgi:HlyD family secretion protein